MEPAEKAEGINAVQDMGGEAGKGGAGIAGKGAAHHLPGVRATAAAGSSAAPLAWPNAYRLTARPTTARAAASPSTINTNTGRVWKAV